MINKIPTIKNKDFPEALNKLIASSAFESGIVELTCKQKWMMEMSDDDNFRKQWK